MIQIHDPTQAPPPNPGTGASDQPPAPSTNDGANAGGDPGNLPADSLESGSAASTYVDNPDKPDPTTVAQIEVLPDEQADDGESDD